MFIMAFTPKYESNNKTMKNRFPILFLFILLKITPIEAQKKPISLNWLSETTPSVKTGISWGVPFNRGEVQPTASFFLKDKDGKTLPLQTWTNAYWDDGSLKWLGLATLVNGDEKGFELGIGKLEKINNIAINIIETPLSINIKIGLHTRFFYPISKDDDLLAAESVQTKYHHRPLSRPQNGRDDSILPHASAHRTANRNL